MSDDKQLTPWAAFGNYVMGSKASLQRWIEPSAGFDAEMLIRLGCHAVRVSKELRECSFESIYMALIVSARLGLEPWGPLGEAHLVAFRSQATLLPGYKGLIKLAMESGAITSARSQVVFAGDTFELDLGDRERGLVHKVGVGDRGEPIGAYAIFQVDGAPNEYEWMPWSDVTQIQNASRARNGPWSVWPNEMARKAVLKRGLKQFPLGFRYSQAAMIDHAASDGDVDGVREIISVDENGTVLDIEMPKSQDQNAHPSRTSRLKDRIRDTVQERSADDGEG